MALTDTIVDKVSGRLTSAASGAFQTVASYAIPTDSTVLIVAKIAAIDQSPSPERGGYIISDVAQDVGGTTTLIGPQDKLTFESGGAIPWDARLSVTGTTVFLEFQDTIGLTTEVFGTMDIVKAVL